MDEKQIKIDKLNLFLKHNKFSNSAWNDRGLNPSDSEMCNTLEQLFNECTENLIDSVNLDCSNRQIKNILKVGLEKFKSSEYDTEEREFICDYFFQLSNIVSIDFKNNLNNWLYGTFLNTLFKVTSFFKGKEKILETLSQDCTKCDSKLETFIIRKEEGIPDYNWTVIQCNVCKGYNLLSKGPNIKESRLGNYISIEQLAKNQFTYEQALIRLKQIQFFRK